MKKNLFNFYEKEFAGVFGIKVFKKLDHCISNYWLKTLFSSNKFVNKRDQIIERTSNPEYMRRSTWNSISDLELLTACPRMDLPAEEMLTKKFD